MSSVALHLSGAPVHTSSFVPFPWRPQVSWGVSPPRSVRPSRRVATSLPLTELWTADGPILARRREALSEDGLRRLLAAGLVQFVVAAVGAPLRWVPLAECHVVWKDEVRPHLVPDPARPFDIFHYPEGWVYLASVWETEDPWAPPVVVLERYDS